MPLSSLWYAWYLVEGLDTCRDGFETTVGYQLYKEKRSVPTSLITINTYDEYRRPLRSDNKSPKQDSSNLMVAEKAKNLTREVTEVLFEERASANHFVATSPNPDASSSFRESFPLDTTCQSIWGGTVIFYNTRYQAWSVTSWPIEVQSLIE
ncbi:hypothetical protein Vi05172_g3680 [Venturia inaequalis]|nr:hypothetical protein Vi05172_g3680 [Venturia inaequalis]